MKILLTIFCLLILVSCSNEVPSDRLVERNGIVYEVNSTTPFTGTSVYDGHLEGTNSSRHDYKEGLLDGLIVVFYDSGQISISSHHRKGIEHGLYETYYKNGQLDIRKNYKDGIEVGPFERYHKNGQLSHKGNYQEDRKSVV